MLKFAVIFFIGVCLASADFKFKNSEPPVIVARLGGSIQIDCTTTDPNAITSLWVRTVVSLSHQRLKPDNSKVFQDGAVYAIKNIKNSDVGFYRCNATNATGDSIFWQESSGFLHVLSGPTEVQLTVSPVDILIAVGESVNFTCQLDTFGQPVTIKWYKEMVNGDFIPVAANQVDEQRNGNIVRLILMITKAIASHQERDIFRCRVTYRRENKDRYGTLHVRVLKAPIVQSFPNGPVNTVKEFQSWKVSCTVEGFRLPNITWLRNDKALPVCNTGVKCSQSDNYITNQTKLKKWILRSTLTVRSIQRPTGSDAANYTCLAMNSLGSARESVRVIIQGTSKVYCEVEPIQPYPKIQWLYRPWLCASHESMCVSHQQWESLPLGHTVLPPESHSTLRSEVTIPDTIEEGFYKCTAENAFGQDSYDMVFSRHVVLIDADETELNAQDTLVIRCNYREANFDAWAKDGSSISTDSDGRMNVSIKVNVVILKVFNLTVNDSGVYTCMSRMPRENASVEITVRDIYKPKIVRFSNRTSFNGNLSIALYCNVSANPGASISWMKDDKSLTIVTQNRKKVDCTSLLAGYYQTDSNQYALVVCHPSHKKNSGKYKCTAKNRLGSQNQTAFLNVQEFAEAEIVNSPSNDIIVVALGDSVNRTCRGSGNPRPHVQWFKLAKGRSDVSHKPDSSNPSQATLYIEAVEEKHLGTYSCFAKSSLGESEVYLKIVQGNVEETPPPSGFSDNLAIGLGVGFGAFLVFAIIVILLIFRYHNKQIAEYRDVFYAQGSAYQFDPKRTLLEQCSDLPYDPDWEFPEERLILGEVLDAGNFGQVHVAEAIGIVTFDARNKSAAAFKRRSTLRQRVTAAKLNQDNKGQQYNRTTVAVKTLKGDATGGDYQDLVSELKIMIHVGQHKNIINLLGACTRGKRLMLIIEFAPHGSLAKFVRKKRDIYEPTWVKETDSPEMEFTIADLAIESYQVARGLEYLASRKCVHRDVAARNVLVSEGYVLKISDFGLARDIYKEEEYVKKTTGALPIKWMALESIYDKVYTEKSDVWSFGVLLWELFTLGGSPYPRIPTERVIDFIAAGDRMECPQNCPVEMYALMRDCWLQNPEQRPTFIHIVDRLGRILENSAAKTSATYISLLNDGQASDYYLRPVESSGPSAANGAAMALAGDTIADHAHALLPPIPLSEFGYESEITDRRRGQSGEGTVTASSLSNCPVENESGIDREDSIGENDKLIDQGGAKAALNEPVIGLRNGQSKPKPGPRDANNAGWAMETAL